MVFRQLAKDSAIYGGADLAGKVLAFFSFPIIAAALSPLAFGTLELVGTTTALLSLVTNCGLNNSVQRYYWDRDTLGNQRPIIVSSGFAAQVVFGLVALTFGLIALPWVLYKVKQAELPLSWLGFVAALLLMVCSQWLRFNLDVVRLHFSPVKFLTLTFLSRVLGIILALLVVVKWQGGVDGFLAVQAFVALAVLPLSLWMVRQDITLKIDWAWIRELVGFGYPFIFAGLGYWLFGSMDRWMLAAMSSVEETGIYSVAFRFASVVLFISTAFAQAWSPTAIKVRTDHPEKYRTIYAQVLLLLLFVMLVAGGGLSLFSGELISLLMPKEYASSAIPLSILCCGIVLQATQNITAIGISLERKTFLFARITWATAFVNLVLNWFFIPKYGAVGAAWATTMSYFVLTGCYLYFTQRLHPLPIQWEKLLLLLTLGVVVASVSICFNSESFQWQVVINKALMALVSILLGLAVLPKISFR